MSGYICAEGFGCSFETNLLEEWEKHAATCPAIKRAKAVDEDTKRLKRLENEVITKDIRIRQLENGYDILKGVLSRKEAEIAGLKQEYTQWVNRWLSLLLDWLSESDARVHAMREELEKLLTALEKRS